MTTLSDSRLSNLVAERIAQGFDEYLERFGTITRRAPARFENADWPGMRRDARSRLRVYANVVSRVVEDVGRILGSRIEDPLVWVASKAVYSNLIADRQAWEVAETFHNSVTRRVFGTVGVDERIEFVDTDFDSPPSPSLEPVYLNLDRQATTSLLVRAAVSKLFDAERFVRLDHDSAEVAERIEGVLTERGGLPVVGRAEIVRSPFYRGQAAYLVGLAYAGSARMPFVLAVRHEGGGLVIDAALLSEDEVSILFSFTRSHFSVDIGRPYDLVRFLGRLMPRKRIAELYISIGQHKHGKTELYRDLLRHLNSTNERFEHVPGTRGMVMIVFGMPGYDDVFKVIRDRFPAPKRTTRSSIMANYDLVSQHDRAGRLIDPQNFQHLSFSRDRFEPALLDELIDQAGKTVTVQGDEVVISQLYVERRVVPLDVYSREAAPAPARSAVIDYGQAIKDLASTNIFPGDMLTKNFGVTRHGRVVFYDYDEICELSDVSFRELPEPRDDLDLISDTPWFPVGDRDIFPEEHVRFLGLPEDLRHALIERHGDIFDPAPWKSMQDRISGGEIMEIFPYEDEARLSGVQDVRSW